MHLRTGVPSDDTDQSAYLCSLIRIFPGRSLESHYDLFIRTAIILRRRLIWSSLNSPVIRNFFLVLVHIADMLACAERKVNGKEFQT